MRSSLLLLLAAPVLWAPIAAAAPPPGDDADVEVKSAEPPEKAPAAPAPASGKPEQGASVDARIEQLEARLAQAEARAAAPPPAPDPGRAPAPAIQPSDFGISFYVQGQYEHHEESQDQLQQGGTLLNQDRFLVRRGRLRLDAAWQFAELDLEVDGNTTRGPSFGLRRAEGVVLWRGKEPWNGKLRSRGPRSEDAPPPVALTLGLTDVPFGFELVDSNRERAFMERSLGSLSFFPGEPDLGVRLGGGLGFFRYAIAIMNGEPLDDRSPRAGRDPNAAKDIVARAGVDTHPLDWLRVMGGASILRGKGFHAGTDSTKNGAQWRDVNENAAIDAGEVTAAPGSAATPSTSFARWAVGLDLELEAKTPLGSSFLYGEATVAENMDRGLFVADPVATGIDSREVAWYAALTQQVTPYGLLGLRVDVYDPNADFLAKRAGKLLPQAQTIRTTSPIVGLVLPGRARLVFQYDLISDSLAKDRRGVPVDLANDRWTLRLQVQQ